jgi:Protein of unknown function (DUF3047)
MQTPLAGPPVTMPPPKHYWSGICVNVEPIPIKDKAEKIMIRFSKCPRRLATAGWALANAVTCIAAPGTAAVHSASVSNGPGEAVRIVIDTFSSCLDVKTKLPCGWQADRHDATIFSLCREQENYFVKIKTLGGTAAIGKSFGINCKATPFLSWRWRAHVLPLAGNEKLKKKDDSGASVYVFFPGPLIVKRILKYVWSTTLPIGTRTVSPFYGGMKIVVLRSGNDSLGAWVHETVNILDDYKKFFGSVPEKALGIALLSDGDNTNSAAEADYDDFFVSGKR